MVSGTAALLLVIVGALVASPAGAASHAGALRIKGLGSVYSGSFSVVAETVAPNATDTFELQVVNTGTELAQYNVKAFLSGTIPATVDITAGSLSLKPLVSGPDGYYTSPIAPGKTLALNLKITIPAGSPQGSVYGRVDLSATDGAFLDRVTGLTEVKAPTYGTTGYDLFAKHASQTSYVGGSLSAQAAASPAISVGSSTTFNIKLQNDGAAPGRVGGLLDVDATCSDITVKDGSADVTAAMLAGTYLTPVLAVHGSKALTVTFKRFTLTGCGVFDEAIVSALDTNSYEYHYSYLVVPLPAT